MRGPRRVTYWQSAHGSDTSGCVDGDKQETNAKARMSSEGRGSRKVGSKVGSGGAWGGGLNQSAIQEHEWNTPVELTFPRLTPLPSKRSRWKIEPKRKPSAPYSLPPSLKAFFFSFFFNAIMKEWQHLMLLSHLRSFGVFQKRLWQRRSECTRCNSVGFKKKNKKNSDPLYNTIGLDSLDLDENKINK